MNVQIKLTGNAVVRIIMHLLLSKRDGYIFLARINNLVQMPKYKLI